MDIVLFDYHFAPDTILAALVFGFLHALEPGHGKTALLAYMADGRKSYWHSVVVGFSSFFSHTASILLISMIVHAATHMVGKILNAQTITWYLSLVSSTALFGVGLYLMIRSFRETAASSECCGHHHDHDSQHKHSDHHHKTEASKFSLSAILGVSVGLYPCPTAIAAYLAALTKGDQTAGYLAIVTYGVGIGLTIMGIGIVSGYFGRAFTMRMKKNITQNFVIRLQSIIFMLVGVVQITHVH
ncbi:MAG: sulfite exporter TauE/SafE family protein [Oligoflexales bacterium]|nr:sulfite exporter TauE/SafE family protein [Oligoflexales bacterium]